MRDWIYFGYRIQTKFDNNGMVYYSIVTDRSGKFREATTDYKSHGDAEKAGKDIAWRWYLTRRRKGELEKILEVNLLDEELERVHFGGEGTQAKVGDMIFSNHYLRKLFRVTCTDPPNGRIGTRPPPPEPGGIYHQTAAQFNESEYYKRREDWYGLYRYHFNVAIDRLKKLQKYIELAFKSLEDTYRWFYSLEFYSYLFGNDCGLWVTVKQIHTEQQSDSCFLSGDYETFNEEELGEAGLGIIRMLLRGFTEHPPMPKEIVDAEYE